MTTQRFMLPDGKEIEILINWGYKEGECSLEVYLVETQKTRLLRNK